MNTGIFGAGNAGGALGKHRWRLNNPVPVVYFVAIATCLPDPRNKVPTPVVPSMDRKLLTINRNKVDPHGVGQF